jgi:tetratricopeptide (TPR) repeat protein
VTPAEQAYRHAQRLAQLGRYEEAERTARDGLASEPGHPHLLTLLASVLRLRRDYPAGLAMADAAVAAAPGLADGHAERAENLIALIRDRDAIAAAGEAVRLDPLDPAGHLVLARALSSARDFDRARAAARRGLALRPRSVEGLLTVADVERDAGHRDAATAAARAALALDPVNSYGRWLIAMLDAERLRVGRSMRGLRDVARDDPTRPDVISMTWPIRGVLSGLRRGLAAGLLLICGFLLLGHWWAPAGTFARILSLTLAALTLGFGARVLIPAGRLPWRCLRLVPPLLRRAVVAGLGVTVAVIGLLIAYATSNAGVLPVIALAVVPVQWALGLTEQVGARLEDPGFRHALRDLLHDFRDLGAELADWWRTTKNDLGDAWRAQPAEPSAAAAGPPPPASRPDPEPPRAEPDPDPAPPPASDRSGTWPPTASEPPGAGPP